MYEAAQKRGISCTLFGDNELILMEKDNHRWFTRGSRTSFQSSVGFTIAEKKQLTKRVLQMAKLPTADYTIVKNISDLEQIKSLHFPVVVKPVAGRHGKNVFVGLQSIQEVTAAFEKNEGPVLVEEQLAGIEYRIVCIDFTFVAATYRKPAFVIGDGVHTVSELISNKNNHPWRGSGHTHPLTVITVDDVVEKNLTEQNLTLETILPKNKECQLRKTNNLSTGGEPHDVTATVHPENKKLFEKIARTVDLNVLGIDFMCETIETPIAEQSAAGVIEINASPGLRMHHFPVQGEAHDVAGTIISFCENQKD